MRRGAENGRASPISNNGAHRLVLTVDGEETALACETAANFGPSSCTTPPGVEVPVPAGSMLAWKTDRGSAAFNTAETHVLASMRLTDG
ncbi:MAG TPA: hypothetical protein VK919_02455 [Solirubrobacterales bacterium]|nr:hypothetical protein [Solirubrobacterales bacterium]